MGSPTNIIDAAAVTDQAAIAAEKMADMLRNMEERLNPESNAFDVPDISGQLADLGTIVGSFGSPGDFESVNTALDAAADSYNAAEITVDKIPEAPVISGTSEVAPITAPSLNATPPALNIPSAPSVTISSAPTAPVINDILTPNAPVVSIPSVPELSDITLPSIESISIPLFTQVFPDVPDDLLAPDAEFFYEEEEYSSEELVALRDLILDDLRNGGWGVNHTDEEALFDREVDRATSAGVTNEETTIETMASRGFELPTGTLAALLRKNQQKTLDEISAANREVSIQRADLIRKSRENVLANSLTLNQTMVTHFGFVQQRMLSAAQSTIDFSLRAFNANVELYNTRVQAYAQYANAWNTQIRGQIANLEAQKAQLEAEALKIDLNKSQIDAYSAQVRATGLIIDIYNTEMQAAKIRSDIERNKLAVFNSEVQAHRIGVDVEVAKIQAFSAQVGAEGLRVDLYKTQVNAYESEARAAKSASDISVQTAAIQLDEQRVQLAAFDSDVRKYTAQVASERASADVAIAQSDGAARTASAQADLVVGQSGLGMEATKYFNEYNQTLGNLRMMEQRNFSDHNIALMKARIENYTKPAEMWQEFYTSLGALASAVDVEIT